MLLPLLLLAAACGPSRDDMRRMAPLVLEQYGFKNVKLVKPRWGFGCPRGYAGIEATAELSGGKFHVAVCWTGVPDQQVAVITRKAPPGA